MSDLKKYKIDYPPVTVDKLLGKNLKNNLNAEVGFSVMQRVETAKTMEDLFSYKKSDVINFYTAIPQGLHMLVKNKISYHTDT